MSLPNDIIMRIIREADGGLHTHKGKFSKVMAHLNKIQKDDEDFYFYFQDEGWWSEARFAMWVTTPKWLEALPGLLPEDCPSILLSGGEWSRF